MNTHSRFVHLPEAHSPILFGEAESLVATIAQEDAWADASITYLRRYISD